MPPKPLVPGVEIDNLIARGTNATVWAGSNSSGRRVAVKVVPYAASDGDPEAGLIRDALMPAGATWPHVVPILNVVGVQTPMPGVAIVMPLLTGGSFAAVVAARGTLSCGEIVTALAPIAAALGSLHASGLVHGDVSSANVLFDEHGQPFLSDFGVARIVGDQNAQVWGTDGFVAPEIEGGSAPSPATDVYALGALAWLGVTGSPPGPTCVREPLKNQAPNVPEVVMEWIERCLAALPQERPSAAEAALQIFDSAQAQPLDLQGGEQDVVALTRRIRAAALPEEQNTPTRRRFSWFRAGPAHAPRHRARQRDGRLSSLRRTPTTSTPKSRSRAARAREEAGPMRAMSPRADDTTGRVRSMHPRTIPAVLAVLGLVLTTAGVAFGRGQGLSEPTGSGAAGSGVHSTAITALTPAEANTSEDPVLVATALLNGRASLWTTLKQENLALVDAPGSPAWLKDANLVGDARSNDLSYVGLGFTVTKASWDQRGASTARLKVAYETSAYDVINTADSRTLERHRAVPFTEVMLHLRRMEEGWRVTDVSDVGSSGSASGPSTES